jgi:hypothetical protein
MAGGLAVAACGGNVVVDSPVASTGGAKTVGTGGTTTIGTGGTTTTTGTGGSTTGWTNGIPPLHTDGRWLKDPNGKIITLRGVALADLSEVDTQRAPINVDKVLDLVSDPSQGWYARVVRLTVFPDDWLPDPSGYLNQHLIPAIEHAAQRKLYAIVDWHEISDPLMTGMRTAQFWTMVAPLLAGYTHVLIEMFNEVQSMNINTWAAFKQVAQPWVDIIRTSAKNQIILIGGPSWDQQIGGAAIDPFAGDNLAYVGHIYPGIDPSVWAPGGPISQAAAVVPVMITEWGYQLGGAVPTNGTQTNFGQPLRMYIDANRLSWTAWCADTMWGPPIFDANWQPQGGVDEMGAFTQKWLDDTKNGP